MVVVVKWEVAIDGSRRRMVANGGSSGGLP